MGEVNGDFNGVNFGNEQSRNRHDWEIGLPNVEDILPLNKGLVPLELLTAFNIPTETYLTTGDVTRASEDTLSSIRGESNDFRPLEVVTGEINGGDEDEEEDDVIEDENGKKPRRNESPEDAGSATPVTPAAAKRSRLVWTPQLHKRFVDVVRHLGIKNAVPKTIMTMMNVEGLTRENVASHLQKYRLYLKRMGPEPAPEAVGPTPVPMMMGMGNYYQYGNGMVMQSGGSSMGYLHHHHHSNSGGQMMN